MFVVFSTSFLFKSIFVFLLFFWWSTTLFFFLFKTTLSFFIYHTDFILWFFSKVVLWSYFYSSSLKFFVLTILWFCFLPYLTVYSFNNPSFSNCFVQLVILAILLPIYSAVFFLLTTYPVGVSLNLLYSPQSSFAPAFIFFLLYTSNGIWISLTSVSSFSSNVFNVSFTTT